MADIRQTNRTMVFDFFNPEKPDILTLVGDVRGVDSLSDEHIKRINEALLVTSYEEFENKFNPKVYSVFDSKTKRVRHSLTKLEGIPDNLVTEISINRNNSFFKMFTGLVDHKRALGIKNVDCEYESDLDMITPNKEMDDILQIRKELQYSNAQYAALEDGDPQKRDLGDKLNELVGEIRVNYGNVFNMFPIAIKDCETRLLLGRQESDGKSERIAAGILRMGDNGELKVLEAPKVDETSLTLTDNPSNQGLIEVLEKDYEEASGDEASNYIKALVVRTFCPLTSASEQEIDIQKETENHNAYLELYTEMKNDFIKTVKPLIEKMMGVREFFEQYTVKGKGMRPSLLIMNIAPEMIAKSNNLPRLLTYLNTVNSKNDYDNTVWFSIFPNLSLSRTAGVRTHREYFTGNKKVENADVNTMETLGQLLKVLHEYGIKTFFSFETREETTFNRIATDGINTFVNRCEPLMDKPYSAYAVPCLPNITVVPKDKSGVITGALMVADGEQVYLSKEKEDIMRLWIEGVYISAAYVGAGIMAACQCPEYLKEHFVKNVHPELPGVRYDIEAGNNALVTKTTLAKEITGFTGSVKSDINNKNFGFIFASENAKHNGLPVDRLTVYKARSLASDGTAFEPIYQTQVEAYFNRIFRQATGDYKQDNIISFFSANPNSQMSKWLNQKDYVNTIIQKGDDIRYTLDEANGTCDIEFVFSGSSRNMRIQLQRSTAGKMA
ncbi:transcriptional regulator [Lacrimispora amygdalina]|uniref:Transcriptional regulator n=1 Tax=Lacrimispora amygdalina TaxID=253257 RepID=A0A3E2NF13_9FIRM|nr:transcriptional regulator [Clostridium indicum]RFZ79602.1 transcriptional regulator [Clostridium indicum]